jgi:predicted NUDIX family phosphoesterase
MIFYFPKEQAEFLQEVLKVDVSMDFSDDEQLELEDKLSDYLQTHGLTNDEENEIGTMCADILTFIANNDH